MTAKLYPFEGGEATIAQIRACVPCLTENSIRRHIAAGRTTRHAMLRHDPAEARRRGGANGRKAASRWFGEKSRRWGRGDESKRTDSCAQTVAIRRKPMDGEAQICCTRGFRGTHCGTRPRRRRSQRCAPSLSCRRQAEAAVIGERQLKEKLKFWIREYGYGGMPSGKTSNLIQTLIDHKGFVPSKRGYVAIPIQTVGDEVEAAVTIMANTPGEAGDENVLFKAAMALRAYYLTPKHWPEEDRIKQLRAIGLPMSRHTYYRNVQLGRAFLMGYLSTREKEVA